MLPRPLHLRRCRSTGMSSAAWAAAVVAMFWAAWVPALAVDLDPKAVELLASRGLTPSGEVYLLEFDANLPDALAVVRKIQAQELEFSRKRSAIEREMESTDAAIRDLDAEAREVAVQLSRTQKTDRKYDGLFTTYNTVIGRLRDAERKYLEQRKALRAVPKVNDDYVGALTVLSAKMDATAEQYKTLEADPAVKAALATLRKSVALDYRLGPSARFVAERKVVDDMCRQLRSQAIEFVLVGGVPEVEVVINNDVSLPMTFDSGAAIVSLSAETARRLNLRPGPNDPAITLVVANGQEIVARVVKLKSMRLGAFVVQDVACAVMPPEVADAANLLGGTFLRNFVARVDLQAGEIYLTPARPGVKTEPLPPPEPPAVAANPPPAAPPVALAPAPPVMVDQAPPPPADLNPPALLPAPDPIGEAPPVVPGAMIPANPPAGGKPVAIGTLESKKSPVLQTVEGMQHFSAPKHDRWWTGANGVMLPAGASWNRHGTVWTCGKFQPRPWGMTFVHPVGDGHILVRIGEAGIDYRTDGGWSSKRGFELLPLSPQFTGRFPLNRDKSYAIRSEVSANGELKFYIDGVLTCSAKLKGGKPMALGTGFSGKGLPDKLPSGYAAVIVDNGYRSTSIAGDLSLQTSP